MTENSAGRSMSHFAAPVSAKRSKASELAWPGATREMEKVPTAPEAKWAVKVATSSFSTGSLTSVSSARAWP